MKFFHSYTILPLSTIFISGMTLSHAQTTEWNAATDNWFTSVNWNNGTPNSTTPSLINNGGTAEVTASGATTLNLFLGSSASTSGTLNVSGAGSLTSADFLTVGDNGTGFLNILSGGNVTAVNSSIAQGTGSGTTTVSGAGSMLTLTGDLTSGSTGTGILDILSGATVTSNQIGSGVSFIGAASDANGTANVTGIGSSWTVNNFLAVGSSGTGTLNITNGGSVSVNFIADIGSFASGNGALLVDGSGSQYVQAGGTDLSLAIGFEGNGSATVSNGGLIDHSSVTEDLFIAFETGSVGALNIGGAAGSNATAAGIVNATGITGGDGTATINLNHTNTDYALTTDGTTSGDAVILSGNLTVNHNGSGTTTLTGIHAYVGGTAINDGTLAVDGSINSDTTVNNGGVLGGNGNIHATVAVQAGGTLAPGNSPGILTINNLDLNGGAILAIELGGTAPNLFDQLDIANGANLDGILNITYLDGFTASVGDEFTIINSGDLTGSFSIINLPDAQDWQIEYDSDNNLVNLIVVPEPSMMTLLAIALPLLFARRRSR